MPTDQSFSIKLGADKEAFDSTDVAAYRPLILDWCSLPAIDSLAEVIVGRLSDQEADSLGQAGDSGEALNLSTRKYALEQTFEETLEEGQEKDEEESETEGVPLVEAVRNQLITALQQKPREELLTSLIGDAKIPLLTTDQLSAEALSPIGIMDRYRHHYTVRQSTLGPMEQAFTLAPYETVEIVLQTSEKRVTETNESETNTNETSSTEKQSAKESTTKKISKVLEKTASSVTSAKAGGSTGVFSGSASAKNTNRKTSKKTREKVTEQVKEVSKSITNKEKRNISFSTRTLQEFSSTNQSRRVVENKHDVPLNYALHRVMNQIDVKVQDLGPKLVWQFNIDDPSEHLAKVEVLKQAEPRVSELELPAPPGMKYETIPISIKITSKPVVGNRTFDGQFEYNLPPGRKFVSFSVSRFKIQNYGRNSKWNGVSTELLNVAHSHDAGTLKVTVQGGNKAYRQGIKNYENRKKKRTAMIWLYLVTDATENAQREWQESGNNAIGESEEKAHLLLEVRKSNLLEEARIERRSSDQLRFEERNALMTALVKKVLPTSMGEKIAENEISVFQRLFEIDEMFYFLDATWWDKSEVEPYSVTPGMMKPLGASNGWINQADGDDRRNMFINSPRARVCLPICHGMERQAFEWLADNIEGSIGAKAKGASDFSEKIEEILTLFAKLEAARVAHPVSPGDSLSIPRKDDTNRDWIESMELPSEDEEIEPWGLDAFDLYPVFDQYSITEPVEGFVYRKIDFD